MVGVLVVAIAIFDLAVIVVIWRWVTEIRGHLVLSRALVDTQAKHETDIRYLRELVNPMARSGRAPMPKHLRQENP